MTIEQPTSINEARVVREIVARHALPAEADGVSLEFGPDQNGDPAVWLVFRLRPELETTVATYETLHSYAQLIRSNLLEAGVERFPYVRVQRISPKQPA